MLLGAAGTGVAGGSGPSGVPISSAFFLSELAGGTLGSLTAGGLLMKITDSLR
jgi:hypothetical protein